MAYFEVGSMQGVFEMDQAHLAEAQDICYDMCRSYCLYSLGVSWDEERQMPCVFADGPFEC